MMLESGVAFRQIGRVFLGGSSAPSEAAICNSSWCDA
jgi:hypothetical protein